MNEDMSYLGNGASNHMANDCYLFQGIMNTFSQGIVKFGDAAIAEILGVVMIHFCSVIQNTRINVKTITKLTNLKF